MAHDDPWSQPYLFVPQDATVQINCTADSTGSPFWAIDLANDSTSVQYQFGKPDQIEILNAHGIFELSRIETPETIVTRLLINNTEVNNQTEIHCSDEISTLVLFVFRKSVIQLPDYQFMC